MRFTPAVFFSMSCPVVNFYLLKIILQMSLVQLQNTKALKDKSSYDTLKLFLSVCVGKQLRP